MVEIGNILTIDHEIIDNNGRIIFEENQKVKVRDTWIMEGQWSKLYLSIWIEPELRGIYIEGVYGIWFPSAFKELK